ncbi:hypothetical protein [Halobellus rubicundus]|uniref:Uncharacterized protein n=1 Tax=Halobellus rubicundus TaxID=2996466 RepID=A0ABD5MGJ5_9EURY
MTLIKRVADDEYRLIGSDGQTITTYETTKMVHPDDWIADARNAGEAVYGPYDWEYVDDRQ